MEVGDAPSPPDRLEGHDDSPWVVMDGNCRSLLVRLQSDLLRAARGRSPAGRWAAGARPDAFVAAVRCLAHVLHHSVLPARWLPAQRRPRAPVHGAQEGWAPGDTHPDDVAGTLAVAAALLAWVRGGSSSQTQEPVRIMVSPGDGRPDRCELVARFLCRQHDLGRHFADDEAVRVCEAADVGLREVDPNGGMLETSALLPAGFTDFWLARCHARSDPSRCEGAEVLAPGDLAHNAGREQVAQQGGGGLGRHVQP